MKSSMILVTASAALGMAAAVDKRAYVTQVDVVTAYVTVTRYEGESYPTAAAQSYHVQGGKPHHTHSKKPEAPVYSPEPVVYTTVVVEDVYPTATPEVPEYQTEAPAPSSVKVQEPASTPAAAPATPTDYSSSALYYHNIHRANHSSPDLTWSEELAQWASNTAHTCYFDHDMGQGSGGYGQNLAASGTSGSLDNASEAFAVASSCSDMWYTGEYAAYAPYFGKNPQGNFGDYGHLTQVLWSGTKEVGCATIKCPKGTMYDGFNAMYTVCNYRPAGNVGGGYADNVKPPLGYAAVKAE